MKRIILCNQPNRLKSALARWPGPVRYLRLVDSQESRLIANYLRKLPGAQELTRAQLYRDRNECFRRMYIDFMGRMNTANHSRHWWSIPFTSKYSIDSALCHDIFNFLLVVDLVRGSAESLVVITNSNELAAQVNIWAKREPVNVLTLIQRPGTLRRYLKRFTPAAVLKAALITLFFWMLTRRYKPTPDPSEPQVVITSLTHLSSFSAPQAYRDAYFGPLVDHVAKSGVKAMVFGLVQERPMFQLKKLKSLKLDVPVVPVEAYTTLVTLLACTFQALRLFFRPLRVRGPLEINGSDVSVLVNRAMANVCRSGEIFMGLRIYYAARRVTETSRVKRWLYPYENRAWEKMLLLGVKSISSQTQMVGYQHATVTLSHTNLMMEQDEVQITPLPDRILTTGEAIKDWLEKEGNYPPGIFRSACALRQSRPQLARPGERNSSLSKVLVALSASVAQSVITLEFLGAAFAGNASYDIRIRPHPTLPLDAVLKIVQLDYPDFYSDSPGSLDDDLIWADVVLYAFSTIGLEAIALNIPAIFLDLGEIMNTDALLGREEFRWSVDDPADLVDVIESIGRMPAGEFREVQQKGREYATAYLTPVTASGLGTFLEA